MDILELFFLIVFSFLTLVFLNIAVRLYKYDSREYKKNASRSNSFLDIIWGRLIISNDHLPDGRVQAGINFNKRENRIEVTGKLSDDTIEEILMK